MEGDLPLTDFSNMMKVHDEKIPSKKTNTIELQRLLLRCWILGMVASFQDLVVLELLAVFELAPPDAQATIEAFDNAVTGSKLWVCFAD